MQDEFLIDNCPGSYDSYFSTKTLVLFIVKDGSQMRFVMK